jgi:hypothetical protein
MFALFIHYRVHGQCFKKFKVATTIIDKENLGKTCEMIENIYCVLANVYREIKDYASRWIFIKNVFNTNKIYY